MDRMAVRSIVLATVLALALVAALAFTFHHFRVIEAKRFCERIVTQVEATRKRDGYAPEKPDPSWWAGRQVPALVRTQDFYLRTSTGCLLRFRDPLAFDDVWTLDSRSTNWSNYDGY